LPGAATFAVAGFVTVVLFFLLRVADEVKDADDDRRHRPERPVPRGLVTLPLLVGLGVGAAAAAVAATVALSAGLVVFLALVLGFMALMAVEFFVPGWLKARPVAYLVSHMAVMPLIDLFVTAAEWWPAAGAPPRGIALFLALSFVNGCVLEIGRKTWAPASEREGVESYSRLWGPRRAFVIWLACVETAALLAIVTGVLLGAPLAIATVIAVAALGSAGLAARFARRPDPAAQKALDAASGLWVLICYAALGGLPLIFAGNA
jgi:4-hydroxybenzoate polyprenyltransferase